MDGVTVYDNGGTTFDRYTVHFDLDELREVELLVGETGNAPNGVCMWGLRYPRGAEHTVVLFDDLPEPVQRAIRETINETEEVRG